LEHIRFNDAADGHAIAVIAGTAFNAGRDISICRVRGDVRLGGVIFTNYTTESVAIHSASWTPHWINRDMLFVTFDYPFNQLHVNRIFGYVPEDNFHAIRFNEKLGFTHAARIDGMFKHNIACCLMKLERSDCRFLGVQARTLQSNVTEEILPWEKSPIPLRRRITAH
jgi:RimJ/RimL family protein N-acetyltransferase